MEAKADTNALMFAVLREERNVECIEKKLREMAPDVRAAEQLVCNFPKLPSDFVDEHVQAAMASCLLTLEKARTERQNSHEKLCEDLHAAHKRLRDAQEAWNANQT